MEESKFHLFKAYSYLESYIDMDLCDSFFEDTEESKINNEKNEQLKIGVIGHLKKLFHALIEAVKKAINKMKNFFKGSYDNKKKKTIEDVKEAIKNNPELAKQVVIMPDFEEKNKLYNEAEKEIDNEIKSDKNDNKTKDELNKIANDILDKFKDNADKLTKESMKRVEHATNKIGKDVLQDISNGSSVIRNGVKVVTIDAAVKMIDRNTDLARMINGALNLELITLADLEKITGSEKEAIKMRKKISKYAKNGLFHRIKVSLLHSQSRDAQSVLDEQLKIILDYINIDEDGHKKNSDASYINADTLKKGAKKHPFLTKKIVGSKENFDKIRNDHQKVKDDINAVNSTIDKIENTAKDIKKGKKIAKEIGKAGINTATKIGRMGKNIVADIPTHMKNKKTTIKMY